MPFNTELTRRLGIAGTYTVSHEQAGGLQLPAYQPPLDSLNSNHDLYGLNMRMRANMIFLAI